MRELRIAYLGVAGAGVSTARQVLTDKALENKDVRIVTSAWRVGEPGHLNELGADSDAFVFVVDSQPVNMAANEELRGWLELNLLDRPLTLLFTKQDLPNALATEDLSRDLNPWRAPEHVDAWEAFEVAAILGAQRTGLEAEVRAMLAACSS